MQLDQKMIQLVNRGLGPSLKNHRVMANAYQKFCLEYQLDPFPANKTQIRRYMAHLISTHGSAEAIANYISGARTLHEIAGFTPPDTDNILHKIQFRGVKRENIHQVKQAKPMTPELLLKISKIVDYQDQIQLVA